MTGYLYDAGGSRVAKGNIAPPNLTDRSTWCDLGSNSFTPTSHDLLGPGGEKLLELDGNDAWIRTNIYANGNPSLLTMRLELTSSFLTGSAHAVFRPIFMGTNNSVASEVPLVKLVVRQPAAPPYISPAKNGTRRVGWTISGPGT